MEEARTDFRGRWAFRMGAQPRHRSDRAHIRRLSLPDLFHAARPPEPIQCQLARHRYPRSDQDPPRLGEAAADAGTARWFRRQRRHRMLDRGAWRRRASVLPGMELAGSPSASMSRSALPSAPRGDPDRPFERISDGPILDRCMQEPVFIADPAVLIENGRWRMWYQSGRPWTAPLTTVRCRHTTFATPNRRTAFAGT